MSLSEYIELRPEFTVDKFIDHAAPTANPGSFVQLDNYIPRKGYIESRRGIAELLHTPDTSWVVPWDPENPIYSGMHTVTPSETEMARCRVILKFEEQANPGKNALTGNNVFERYWGLGTAEASMVTSYYGAKQGVYALYMGDDTAIKSGYQSRDSGYHYGLRGVVPNPDPFNWPCYSGADTQVSFVSFWCYIPSHAKGGSNYFFTMGNTSNASGQAIVFRYWLCGSGSIRYQGWYTSTAGGSSNLFVQTPYYVAADQEYLTAGIWHFFAVWTDLSAKKNIGFYHYRSDTGYEHYAINCAGLTGRFLKAGRPTIGPSCFYNAITSGYKTDVSDQILASIDYWTYWDSIYTNNTSNVTLARDIKNLHA